MISSRRSSVCTTTPVIMYFFVLAVLVDLFGFILPVWTANSFISGAGVSPLEQRTVVWVFYNEYTPF